VPSPSTIQEILMIFPINTDNLLRYRFFDDRTGKVPVTGDVGGLDIFRDLTDTGEFVGNNVSYVVPHHYRFTEPGHYLKMQAQNGASSTLIANAIVLIERTVPRGWIG